MCINIVKKFK